MVCNFNKRSHSIFNHSNLSLALSNSSTCVEKKEVHCPEIRQFLFVRMAIVQGLVRDALSALTLVLSEFLRTMCCKANLNGSQSAWRQDVSKQP